MVIRSLINQTMMVGTALALIGAGALLATFDIPLDPDGSFGARTFPLIGAGALIVLGLVEIVSGFNPLPDQGLTGGKKTFIRILLLLLLSIFYVWIMSKLGYLVSTALVAPAALMLFGIRNPVGLLMAAILCPAIYHAVFFIGLAVFPPMGEWFDLLDLLQQ